MMQPYVGTTSTPVGEVETWPRVRLGCVEYYVAPVYLAPIARCDLDHVLRSWGCELPSRELVDAIWEAADLRLNPWKLTRRPMTWKNACSAEAFEDQRRRVEEQIAGREFTLLAGSHKDFADLGSRVDLYGWHTLDGVPIEKGATSHNALYVDYSQGLRLVRRVP